MKEKQIGKQYKLICETYVDMGLFARLGLL